MRMLIFLLSVIVFAGCSQICQFGTGGFGSGFKCHSIFAKAKAGMTQKEAEEKLGTPSRRQTDVNYRNKVYNDVWIYDSDPPTVLYFKNGILEQVEYEE